MNAGVRRQLSGVQVSVVRKTDPRRPRLEYGRGP